MKKKTKQQRLHWPLIEKDDSFVIDAPFSSPFLSLSQHHEVEQTKQKKNKKTIDKNYEEKVDTAGERGGGGCTSRCVFAG